MRVRVAHLTLTAGKPSEAVCACLRPLVTQAHRKFSTGLQEHIEARSAVGIGNSAHTAKGAVLLLGLYVGGRGDLKRIRGVAGRQQTGHDRNQDPTPTLYEATHQASRWHH